MKRTLGGLPGVALLSFLAACGDGNTITAPTPQPSTAAPSTPAPPPAPPAMTYPTPGGGNTTAATLCSHVREGVACQVQKFTTNGEVSVLMWNTGTRAHQGNLTVYRMVSNGEHQPTYAHQEAALQPNAAPVLLTVSLPRDHESQTDAYIGQKMGSSLRDGENLLGYLLDEETPETYPTPGPGDTTATEMCKSSKYGVACRVQTFIPNVEVAVLMWNTGNEAQQGNLTSYRKVFPGGWQYQGVYEHQEAVLQPGAAPVLLRVGLPPCASQTDVYTGQKVEQPPHDPARLLGYVHDENKGLCDPPSCDDNVKASLGLVSTATSDATVDVTVRPGFLVGSAVLDWQHGSPMTPVSGVNAVHSYPRGPAETTYTATLRVTHADLLCPAAVTVKVPPVVPTCEKNVQASLALIASTTSDSSVTVTVLPRFQAGSAVLDWQHGTPATPVSGTNITHSYPRGSTETVYTATLRVTHEGITCPALVTVKVPPLVPTCERNVQASLGIVSMTTTDTSVDVTVLPGFLTGSAVLDWQHGLPATPASGVNATHSYPRGPTASVYTATLRVSFADLICPASVTVKVPPLVASCETNVQASLALVSSATTETTFDVTLLPGFLAGSAVLDWQHGSPTAPVSGVNATHSYPRGSEWVAYYPTLRVTYGDLVCPASLRVKAPPLSTCADVKAALTLTGVVNADSMTATASASWIGSGYTGTLSWGDGGTTNLAAPGTASHDYVRLSELKVYAVGLLVDAGSLKCSMESVVKVPAK